MQLPFGRYIVYVHSSERTHANIIIGDGRKEGGSVQKVVKVLLLFLIFGAVVMKIAWKLFLSLMGGASAGVSCQG